MARMKQQQPQQRRRSGSSDSVSSSPSSPVVEDEDELLRHPSSSSPAENQTVNATTLVTSDTVEAVPTSEKTDSRDFTASERRRQQTLFLADAEQFTFDFGGEAPAMIAETVVADEAAQRAARRVEDLADATARAAAAASAGHKASTTAVTPLTTEEVSAFAAAALARGTRQFLTLPQAGAARRRRAQATSSASAGTAAAVGQSTDAVVAKWEGATLEEALPLFKAALRRYDEGLWLENKLHREEEQKRNKTHKRQRA